MEFDFVFSWLFGRFVTCSKFICGFGFFFCCFCCYFPYGCFSCTRFQYIWLKSVKMRNVAKYLFPNNMVLLFCGESYVCLVRCSTRVERIFCIVPHLYLGFLFNFNSLVNFPFVDLRDQNVDFVLNIKCGFVATKSIYAIVAFPLSGFTNVLQLLRQAKSLWWAWFFIGYIVSNRIDFCVVFLSAFAPLKSITIDINNIHLTARRIAM